MIKLLDIFLFLVCAVLSCIYISLIVIDLGGFK